MKPGELVLVADLVEEEIREDGFPSRHDVRLRMTGAIVSADRIIGPVALVHERIGAAAEQLQYGVTRAGLADLLSRIARVQHYSAEVLDEGTAVINRDLHSRIARLVGGVDATVLLLERLGGMMPGTQQVVDSALASLRAARDDVVPRRGGPVAAGTPEGVL